MASRVVSAVSGWFSSHWSARSASTTSRSGTVPYSSAMPVYSACAHSS
jgi:hypothetical protein